MLFGLESSSSFPGWTVWKSITIVCVHNLVWYLKNIMILLLSINILYIYLPSCLKQSRTKLLKKENFWSKGLIFISHCDKRPSGLTRKQCSKSISLNLERDSLRISIHYVIWTRLTIFTYIRFSSFIWPSFCEILVIIV